MLLHMITINILIKMIVLFPCDTRKEYPAVADYYGSEYMTAVLVEDVEGVDHYLPNSTDCTPVPPSPRLSSR